MSTPERIYRRLLRMYPADFRRDYAEPMSQLFADRARDARIGRGPTGMLQLWVHILVDTVTTAASQHLERDRTMAHSAAPVPTVSSRAMGMAGILAGAVLLAPFVITFEDAWFAPHIILFDGFVIAVAFGMHRRQATSSRALATAATAGVVIANAWYLAMTALSMADVNPFGTQFGVIYFWASMALWLSAAGYGAASLVIGAFRRWGPALLVIGSLLAVLGIDRIGLVTGDSIFVLLSQIGIVLHGLGWIILGAELAWRSPRLERTAA